MDIFSNVSDYKGWLKTTLSQEPVSIVNFTGSSIKSSTQNYEVATKSPSPLGKGSKFFF